MRFLKLVLVLYRFLKLFVNLKNNIGNSQICDKKKKLSKILSTIRERDGEDIEIEVGMSKQTAIQRCDLLKWMPVSFLYFGG